MIKTRRVISSTPKSHHSARTIPNVIPHTAAGHRRHYSTLIACSLVLSPSQPCPCVLQLIQRVYTRTQLHTYKRICIFRKKGNAQISFSFIFIVYFYFDLITEYNLNEMKITSDTSQIIIAAIITYYYHFYIFFHSYTILYCYSQQ